jgi:3-phenylpropionate/cinnamic acid dioxygenase small subunit
MRALKWDTLQAAQQLIYESCLLLNAEQWDDYLKLCDSSLFRYRITNYSPEMRKEQCWMDRDYASLKHLIDLLPKHNSDRSQLTRHAVVYKVGYDEKQGNASMVSAVTSVTLYRTQLDGIHSHFESGRTSLYAVGSYLDSISLEGPEPKLVNRTVRLDTRQLDIGSHYLF